MNNTTIIGIDLAKNIFQVCVLNEHHKIIKNQSFNRVKLIEFIHNQAPCLIAFEACGSAHYWAKTFLDLGHQVKMLPPSFVKGFVYGNKHDKNDAKAIAMAATQPDAPIVQVKSDDQLVLQSILRIRERRIEQRTSIINQIRSLCYEFGYIIAPSVRKIRDLDLTQIPSVIYETICELYDEFKSIDSIIRHKEKEISKRVNNHPIGKKLLAVPGIGIINALACLILNPSDYKNGRHLSAYLGLVPKMTGTGGKMRTQGLSKRGNTYHRTLMLHGARAWLAFSKNQEDKLKCWITNIRQKRGFNTAVAALANKLCRIIWHILQGKDYQVNLAVA